MEERVPFLEMFPCCEALAGSFAALESAQVISVTVSREAWTMTVLADYRL